MSFGVKNFIVRNDSKNKNKMVFECYNLINPRECGVVTF
jgi:hypothetical protein